MKGTYYAVAVLLTMLGSAGALKCYTCQGSSCKDSYIKPTSHENNCDSGYTYCFKFKGEVNGEEYVSRTCGPIAGMPANPGVKCEDNELSFGGVQYKGDYCYCDTDLCNASGHLKCTFGLFASVLAAVFFI